MKKTIDFVTPSLRGSVARFHCLDAIHSPPTSGGCLTSTHRAKRVPFQTDPLLIWATQGLTLSVYSASSVDKAPSRKKKVTDPTQFSPYCLVNFSPSSASVHSVVRLPCGLFQSFSLRPRRLCGDSSLSVSSMERAGFTKKKMTEQNQFLRSQKNPTALFPLSK